MPDPVTALLVGFGSILGGIAGKASEKAIKLGYEKALEHGVSWLHGEVLVRTAGEFGLATNHDAERAVRRAQIWALTALLRAYERDVPLDDEQAQFPGDFLGAATAFVTSARKRCEEADLVARADQIAKAIATLDAALVPVRNARFAERLPALRAAAEQSFFAEFAAAIGQSPVPGTSLPIIMPEGFRALFFNGWEKEGDREAMVPWHDAFVLFAVDALKSSDETFRKLHQVTRIAGIVELGQDTNEAVRRLESGLTALAGDVQGGAETLARLEGWLGEAAQVWERIETKTEAVKDGINIAVDRTRNISEQQAVLIDNFKSIYSTTEATYRMTSVMYSLNKSAYEDMFIARDIAMKSSIRKKIDAIIEIADLSVGELSELYEFILKHIKTHSKNDSTF